MTMMVEALLEGDPGEEIETLIKLKDPWAIPARVRR